MKRKLTTPAVTYPVTAAEAKERLVIETTDDDSLIADLISAATNWAEQYMGRSIMPQVYTYYFDCFPAELLIYTANVSGISLKYDDSSDIEQTFTDYQTDLINNPILIKPVTSWPEIYDKPNAIRVEVSEGSSIVPESIKTGVLLLVGHLYNNREGSSDRKVNTVPLGVESFLDTYKLC